MDVNNWYVFEYRRTSRGLFIKVVPPSEQIYLKTKNNELNFLYFDNDNSMSRQERKKYNNNIKVNKRRTLRKFPLLFVAIFLSSCTYLFDSFELKFFTLFLFDSYLTKQ